LRIRFHLDEHISAHVAAGLRQRNIDVTTTAEAGLISATHIAQQEFASSTGRVLVTHDGDSLRVHAQGLPHAGLAYCQQESVTVGEMLRGLILIHDFLNPAEMTGKVEFL
jgi:predicted nuclease of predicted toxin-antitoxin system